MRGHHPDESTPRDPQGRGVDVGLFGRRDCLLSLDPARAGRHDDAVESSGVVDEDEALELLAYLVTAARTQVDEAAEYGPMRLLTAAHRLAETIASRASPQTVEMLAGPLARMPLLAVPRDDQGAYIEQLDGVCRDLAAHLLARQRLTEASPP